MRRALFILALWSVAAGIGMGVPCASLAAQASAPAPEQSETIDRIVARIESDVILLSEVRELAAYQQLIDGRSQSEEQLVSALIEQWVVRDEAQESRFPTPSAAEVDAESQRIQNTFPSAEAYRDRMKAVGLTAQGFRRIVEQQLYLERYLDYKFRPAVQVADDAIAKYYQDELASALNAKGQTVPPLDEVRDRIREVLVQRGISERANTWFEDTKSRLQVEIAPTPSVEGKR